MTPPSPRRDTPSIAIIGAGRVGTALGALAARQGVQVIAVAARSDERAREAAARIGAGARAASVSEAAGLADLVLITTPDDAIEPVCNELASAGVLRRGCVVAHCSGALTSESLAAARAEAGCRVASFHPLQTFPDLDAAMASLPGSHVFMEGDAEALAQLAALAEVLGMRCTEIATASKALYHAAAVMACNYLCALMDAALAVEERAGIERGEAWEALAPLVHATLDNVSRLGPEAALTGPIVRGDVSTVGRHLDAMADHDQRLEGVYRALGLWACELAQRSGRLDAEVAGRLEEMLGR